MSEIINIKKMKPRTVRRFNQGLCVTCGKPRENPDFSMWCDMHLKEEQDSHTKRLSE